MQQKILVALTVVFALGIGIFVGTKIPKKSAVPQRIANGADNTYQSGWDAAMQALRDSGAAMQMPEGAEIKTISGTIESIAGSNVAIKISTPGLMRAPELITRTVTVDSGTKIMQLVQKDQIQIQKEFEAFNEKIKQQQAGAAFDSQNAPYPPKMQDKKDASFSDLKVGQIIIVTSGENVKDKQQFVANEINIQQVATTPENLSQPVAVPANTDPSIPTSPEKANPTAVEPVVNGSSEVPVVNK